MTSTPTWPPKSAPRLFVDGELAASAAAVIEGGQAHYLARVMRVGVGDAVVLCDNLTGEWAARVVAVDKRVVELVVETLLRPRAAVPDFVLCAALLKKDRFDLVLEKACELGVRSIQPVLTRRCVADKLNLERAQAVLIEAAEQCGRTALPQIAAPIALPQLLRAWEPGRTLFFADEEGGNPALAAFAAGPSAAALLMGPEGGFAAEERAAVCALGAAIPISLGPRILRGETAAIAATALWMAAAGDWSPTSAI